MKKFDLPINISHKRNVTLVAIVSLIFLVALGITVFFVNRGHQIVPEKPGLEPIGVSSEYIEVAVKDPKENPTAYHNQKIMVEGVYRWGLEDSNFDEVAGSEEYNIWVETTAKTKLENTPGNYLSGGKKILNPSARVTIYGSFQAYDVSAPSKEPPTRGNFGHLGLWKYQIVADKIVFKGSWQDVEAVTDKIRYSLDEAIIVEVKNNLDRDIWISMLCNSVPFVLQKQNGSGWEDYSPDPPTKACAAPLAQQVEASGQRAYQFNVKQKYEHTNVQIKPGAYRFSFRYSLVNPNFVGQKVQFFDALSNEFTIETPKSSQLNARIVGSYTSPGESSKVAMLGDVAYLTNISQGLLAIDVSDPTKPKLIDSIQIDGGGAYAVATGSQLPKKPIPAQLFVSGYGSSRLVAIDVSDPKNLKIVGRGEAKRSIQNMISFGSNLYLAIDGPEFEMLPDTLKSGRIIPATPGGHVLSLEPSITKFLAAQGEKGLAIFELGRGFPILQDTIDVGGYTYDVATYRGVVPIPFREYAYVITEQKLVIVDITMPRNPTIKSRLSLAFAGEAIDLAPGLVAVAEWEKGVEIIDVTNPDNPISLGVVDTPGRARDVAIQQKGDTYYIYVADDRDDLQIIEFRR